MTDIMNQLAISGVSVAVLVGILVQVIKTIPEDNEKIKKYLPLIAAGMGAVLGLLASGFVFPDLIAYMIVGAQMGLSATGGYESIKNLTKG